VKTIKCPECKEEILVVPDKDAMSKVIQNHVYQHSPAIRYEIEESLIQQLLQIASEETTKQ